MAAYGLRTLCIGALAVAGVVCMATPCLLLIAWQSPAAAAVVLPWLSANAMLLYRF